MSDAEGLLEKASGIIPEMWHDLLARVVPGLVILASILMGTPAIKGISEFGIGEALGILVAAYLIGMLVDIFSSTAVEMGTFWNKNHWLRLNVYDRIANFPESKRVVVQKMFAESILFRSLFCYSLCHLISSAFYFSGLVPYDFLVTCFGFIPRLPLSASLVLTASMLLCWLRMTYYAYRRFSAVISEATEQPNSGT